ncbi:hypothetical protein CUC53_18670 [Aeromonas cavernicola]|uniref:Uncharacterized protein n=2 Tax=Aeromonas cavernicola TaxID=1006623 RepID=A0A2H9TZT8_9GAMM|nr:hypothetical protein CUC53_18670 [Aeromonas cavernicola]
MFLQEMYYVISCRMFGDKFVLVRKIKNSRVKEPWVTNEVENLVRWKKAAYMRFRKQASDGAIEERSLRRG